MRKILSFTIAAICTFLNVIAEQIPLPEHPRPDFERTEWINLNGTWNFTFNQQLGTNAIQQNNTDGFDLKIQVPFGWGSKLSGVENKGDQGWYARSITVPKSWEGKRIYLVVGASEWNTQAWLNGQLLGRHQGGYTPFEFELTKHITFGQPQNLVINAEDPPIDRLAGKQGYGDVRGIWQTVYLEARGNNFVDYVHFYPDIDRSVVKVEVALNQLPDAKTQLKLNFKNGEQADFIYTPGNKDRKSLVHTFEVKLANQHLWSLDDPYLYEMVVSLLDDKKTVDQVSTYFGQRKISVVPLSGTAYPYIALNNVPVYLQMCLDQSYHPDGFYTFPSDQFMREEIMLSKRLGLNGNRIHIKAEIPRKLYWADKLGLLIMADVPNWWGEPNDVNQKDWEYCMRSQVKRDFNHPAIFSWVNFNEKWGLFNKVYGKNIYKPEIQEWVRKMYLETKKLDPTRLVEDNSPCNLDHVQTDINSWHYYAPGYEWENLLDNFTKNTYAGSTWNFINGNKQGNEPLLNSECGNVWGYEGSTGDVDITWDYHKMINAFRAHPQCAGWLYTEHHDVINEWNGYVRYDRTPKEFGLDAFVPDMSMADLHSAFYVVPRCELIQEVKAGSSLEIPLFASFMTGKDPGALHLETNLIGWDVLGHETDRMPMGTYQIGFKPFMNEKIQSAKVTLPYQNGLYVLQLEIKNLAGQVLGRNFTLFLVKDGGQPVAEKIMKLVTFAPESFTAAKWTLKQWDVFGGKKVNGAGDGYFEYTIAWPENCALNNLEMVTLSLEASAKELFGKDAKGMEIDNTDLAFMRGKGTHDPCANANSYAQTDQKVNPSMLAVSVNGINVENAYLPDDPADHRGVLSWYAQPRNKKLDEAGSYGYLVEVNIPKSVLVEGKPIKIRLSVPDGVKGGLAIYGKDFGRYPMDPTLVFINK